MDTVMKIESNSLSFFICLILLFNIKTRARNFKEYRVILLLITLIMSAIGLNIICWCVATIGNQVGSDLRSILFFIYYIANNLIPFVWFIYIYLEIFGNIKRNFFVLISIPFILSLFLLFANPFTGDLYRITSQNIYYRGSFFYFNVAIAYTYLISSSLAIIFNRHKLSVKYYCSLVLFTLPPLVGSIFQFAYGGIDLIWPCASISILFIYLGIMQDKLSVDHLTGLYNRMQMNEYINDKIKQCTSHLTFSGMMLDVDDFKYINDNFGHQEGDKALKTVSYILKNNVNRCDFVARHSGDEFVIILETNKIAELKKAADKIVDAFKVFNLTSNTPYKLSISIGYAVYEYHLKMSRREFLHNIDKLMYSNKRTKKRLSSRTLENIIKGDN